MVVLVGIIPTVWVNVSASPPPMGRTESETRILKTLHEVLASRDLYANVPPPDGRMLRILAESVAARNVVEIGTSTGVSGLWMCLALDRTGGKLNTFELDAARAATARRHFDQAGVSGLVNLVEGDAHQNIRKVQGPVDLAFIDAEKSGYLDYLHQLLPMVRPGGLILAHNVEMVPDYMAAVKGDPSLETVVFTEGAGMAVTLKKR